MQTPSTPPSSPLQPAAGAGSQRKRSPLKTIGFGCGGFLLLLVVLLFVRSRIGRKTVDTSGLAGQRTFASRANSQGAVPSQDQMRLLARNTLLDFNRAVQTNDFSAFHATVAAPFAAEYSPAQMRRAFGRFIQQKTDLRAIGRADVVLQPRPSIDESGVLNLSGFFSVQPQPVYFKNKYVLEDAQWKLLAIDVQLGAPIA